MEKTIRLFAEKKEGGKFYQFTFKNSQGKYTQLKFKRDVNLPKIEGNGYYLLQIREEFLNPQKITYMYNNEPHTKVIIWASNIISLNRDVEYEQQLNEEYKQLMKDILG